MIIPGETVADRKTIFFTIWTSEGLLADGGSDGNYEGALATSSGATLQYEHNRDGWVTALGTFGHNGNGEFYYIFDNTEVARGLSVGSVAFGFIKTGFRTQIARVDFGTSGNPLGTSPPLPTKVQFVSNESLQIIFPPFVDAISGSPIIGTDVATLVVKKPNSTLLVSPPAPVFDTDTHLWTATISSAAFLEGLWMAMVTSNAAGARPQYLALTWGDYVDDIQETRQAAMGRWKIDAVTNLLHLYEDDGTTVFKSYNLKDSTGAPSTSQIFERDPI